MSSVTFPTAIGGDGSTVTDDDNATTGLRNGGWRTRFIPCFTNLVNIANYVVTYTASTTAFATPPPIGSTTPNTGAFTRVTVTGSTAPANGTYLPGTNILGFATNSTERVRIDSSGNVGIGTSLPGTKLDIGSGTLRIKNAAGDTSGLLIYQAASDTSTIFNYYSGPLVFGTGNAEKMRLDASGNLGLGVTPSGWDSTYKAMQISRTSLSGVGTAGVFANNVYYSGGWKRIAATAAGSYVIDANTHAWNIAASGSADSAISFTQAMTLDASGNLLVGTTTSPAGNARFRAGNGAGNEWSFGPNTGSSFLVYNPSSVGVYIATGNTSWTATSDERLKTDLEPIKNAAEKVTSLRAVTGRFKTDDEGVSRSFLIAQDVLAVLPEAVDSSDPDRLGVQYTEVIPLLVAAIKELSAELNEIKKRLS